MKPLRIRVNNRDDDKLSVLDRGLQFGDGIFETVALCKGKPLLWEQHWQRLASGCHRLSLPLPEKQELESEINKICQGLDQAIIKLILTRGNSGRGYAPSTDNKINQVVYVFPWPNYPVDWSSQGVLVQFCKTKLSHNSLLAGIKHLNRLEQVLARSEWQDSKVAEGLVTDQNNYVIEGTYTNIFTVFEKTLFTPDLSHCGVAGVMRHQVIKIASELDIAVEETKLSVKSVENADEIFLTNSIIGIWPVRELQQKQYAVGPITRILQQHLREYYCG